MKTNYLQPFNSFKTFCNAASTPSCTLTLPVPNKPSAVFSGKVKIANFVKNYLTGIMSNQKFASDLKDSDGNNWLHFAILLDDSSLIEKLIGGGVNIDAVNADGKTPFILSLEHRCPTSTQTLVTQGSSQDVPPTIIWDILTTTNKDNFDDNISKLSSFAHYAIDSLTAEKIVEPHSKYTITLTNSTTKSAMCELSIDLVSTQQGLQMSGGGFSFSNVYSYTRKQIGMGLSTNFDPTTATLRVGSLSPVKSSFSFSSGGSYEKILDNNYDNFGWQYTPFLYACNKYIKSSDDCWKVVAKAILNLQIDTGVFDPGFIDNSGYNYIHWAVFLNDPELVEFLVERGVDINHLDHEDRSPLMLISKNNCDDDLIKSLVTYGADTTLAPKELAEKILSFNLNEEDRDLAGDLPNQFDNTN
jgi:hypothetical protein